MSDLFVLDVIFEHGYHRSDNFTNRHWLEAEVYEGRFESEDYAHRAAREWIMDRYPNTGRVLSVTTRRRE